MLFHTETKTIVGRARDVDCSQATLGSPRAAVIPPTRPMSGSSRNFQTRPIVTRDTIVGKKNTERTIRFARVSRWSSSAAMKPNTTSSTTETTVNSSVIRSAFQNCPSWKSVT